MKFQIGARVRLIDPHAAMYMREGMIIQVISLSDSTGVSQFEYEVDFLDLDPFSALFTENQLELVASPLVYGADGDPSFTASTES